MTNQEIAQILVHISQILDIQGENSFKIRAYIKAAETVESLTYQLSSPSDKDELKALPGIGEGIGKKIRELLETGKLKYYEDLKKSEYDPLTELLGVPGMGPKHVKLVYDQLSIRTIKQLEKAAQAGRLRDLPGWGPKLEQNILEGIRQAIKHKERFPLAYIYPLAQEVLQEIEGFKEVRGIILAGSLRRMKETIADIDILVKAVKPEPVMNAFVKIPQMKDIIAQATLNLPFKSKTTYKLT